jgi:outer membrane lipoprotein SlyB
VYDYNHPDPRYNGYYADRYYRADPRYGTRVLTRNDRIYRGQDGRYYCRRSDGTTGLLVGGAIGGILGNIIAPGGSRTIGTLIGAAGGAAVGAAVDQNQVRCD